MDTSYLSQQVTTIIERLHGFFDEIGVPSHERDSRESELFSALSETLHNQLNLVAKEKHDLTEEVQHFIKTIRQMERSLDDSRPADDYDYDYDSAPDGLQITYPLLACITNLKEKHHAIAKLHRERYEQVKKLVEALDSYASHLEASFVKLKLPPTSPTAELPPAFDLSQTYVAKLDAEFTRVYEEYNKRIATVSQCADDIISLWSELGTPQAQIDSQIVQFAREAPEQLGLHQSDMKRLAARRDKLIAEKQQRERKLKDLRATVEGLWERLGVDDGERRQFLAKNRGCGLRQINDFEDELSRLNELKRQNLHIFVEDVRFKLQEMWDGLYFSEEEMLAFTPAFSDVYSDALLLAHEQELTRLEALKTQRAPILAAVDKHRSLIQDREDLEKSSQDASRLTNKTQKGEKRDPGKLLREEKMRKRIAKDLPKIEAELRKTLEAWEDEYSRPFCVHGERYLDELEAVAAKAPLPPRSKTPNALQPAREAPKSAGRSVGPQSQSRNGTVRGAPPPRSKTPTANMGRSVTGASMMSSSTMASASSSKSMSPSKIPGASRLPMSSLRDGNNSPERRLQMARSHTALGQRSDHELTNTVRGGNMAPPPRAPPPKMKELCMPPPPTPTPRGYGSNKENGTLDVERGASVVRHVEPEDPYDEPARYRAPVAAGSEYQKLHHPSTSSSGTTLIHALRPEYPRSLDSYTSAVSTIRQAHPTQQVQPAGGYPLAPPTRHPSASSSILTGSYSAASASEAGAGAGGNGGSENWETYTDASSDAGDEVEAAYYARMRAGQNKRPAVGGQDGAAKRFRDSSGAWVDEGVGGTY